MNTPHEINKDVLLTSNYDQKEIQKNEVLKQKNMLNMLEKREKPSKNEHKPIYNHLKTYEPPKPLYPPQPASDSHIFLNSGSYNDDLSSSTTMFDKPSKESATLSNQSLPSISSLQFHRPVMSIQSMLGQEPVSWNTNAGSPNKNYTVDTLNSNVNNWNSVSSIIHLRLNDMFCPNVDLNHTKPINQPHSLNNILIHDNAMEQDKQAYSGYQDFHSFNQQPQLSVPLFPNNNMMLPPTLPSLSQGQSLNQNIDRGKQYVINHMDESYNSPTSKIKFSNKLNTTSPKVQKNTHSRMIPVAKLSDYYSNDHSGVEYHEDTPRQTHTTKSKSKDTNHYSYKTNTMDSSFKTSQEISSQKKTQKETKKQSLQPIAPFPRPKLIVKNDAVMNFIQGIEETDLGEHIYTPSNPVPCLDGKLNGILTIRIARQYFYKSENESIRKRALWGTDIYTDDSDIVAILLHTGRLGKKNPSKDAIVKVRVLPRLIKYSGSLRHNIMSRGWKTRHDGESIMVEDLKWVEDESRRGRKEMKERIAARYQLQLSL